MYYWSAEREAELRQYIADKYSSGQTAEKMGLTRNKVCGKANRMGLRFLSQEQPPRGSKPKPRTRRGWGISKSIFREGPIMPEPPPKPPEFLGLTFAQIEAGQCRYIDDSSGQTLYCGAPTEASFCNYHHSICYHRVNQGVRNA